MIIHDREIDPMRPLPIPTVVVYGPDGKACGAGYYAFHEKVAHCFEEDARPEDYDHVVVIDGFTDWGFKRDIEMKKIVPDGGKVEIVYPRCSNVAEIGFECSECGFRAPLGAGLPGFKFCPGCGRELHACEKGES